MYNIDNIKNLPTEIKNNNGQHFAMMYLIKDKKTGRTNKLPICITTGEQLQWKKHPEQLGVFNGAIEAYKAQTPKLQAKFRLGMLLAPNWIDDKSLVVIDIDDRKDLAEQARKGKITSDDVQAKVVKFGFEHNFYIEISQSGEGLHLIQLGHKHNEKLIRNSKFEYYDKDRWICLTGDCVNKPKDGKLGLDDSAFKKLESMMFPEKKDDTDNSNADTKNLKAVTNNDSKVDPQKIKEIITKAENAKNGDDFKDLYEDKTTGNESDDDMSFACRLAFWTNHNSAEMDYIFRHSKRMRPKWDEVHSADGKTYGQMVIEKAIKYVKKGYKATYTVDDSKKGFTNKDLFNALKEQREIWDKAHTFTTKKGVTFTEKIWKQPYEVIKILINNVKFAKIYSNDEEKDIDLYGYNYDKGIYVNNDGKDKFLEQLILGVAPEMYVTKTRLNMLDTIFKMPTDKIPTVKNPISTPEGMYKVAVGNGILDLRTKQLTPFSPKHYYTGKIDTPYSPLAGKEPIYNDFSFSNSLKTIADGDLDKYKLLWQTCKAAILGCWWLRQFVLLMDDGHGQTGKSTFESIVEGICGSKNVAQIKLSEFHDETKLFDACNKRLIVGDDNNPKKAIKEYEYINPVISAEPVRVRDYYKKSKATVLHSFILQSCNGIPPFEDAQPAFWNRVKIIYFHHHHNHAKYNDWVVKNGYINRPELKQWILWYVVNKVHVGICLTDTAENKKLINQAKMETDTIDNFVKNWLPKLQSTVIPTSWLYDYYCVSCVMDNIASDTLSINRFGRELMNNTEFKKHWYKDRSRVNTDEFLYSDVQKLMDCYNSTRWGKDLKTGMPITNISSNDNHGTTYSKKVISKYDYTNFVNNYSNKCYIRK